MEKKQKAFWVWWCTLIILVLRRLRKVDCLQFEASLGYTVSFRPAWTTE